VYKLSFLFPTAMSKWSKVPYSPPVADGSALRSLRMAGVGPRPVSSTGGSQPFLGEAGQVEQVEEWKVELVVADELIRSVVAALKDSHPYETPAYEVWRLEDFDLPGC
jgi:hypothetical protein